MSARKIATPIIALALAASAIGAAFPASAIEIRDYDMAEFDAAKEAGTPIIVDIHAVWCPTCQAQRAVLHELEDDPRFADVVVFSVDYDTERQIMRIFAAPQRSTFIGFREGEEIGRLHAQTAFGDIEAFLLTLVD